MTFRIKGFGADAQEEKEMIPTYQEYHKANAPRKSLVQVRFPGRGMALTYFNDLFDLKVGDRVYVDGKLEGQLGHIVDISYNFKIKIADYQKVIAVADTNVHGQLYMAGSHFVSFDPTVLPIAQVSMWFKAPVKDDDVYVSSTDDFSFHLGNLKGMDISPAIAERGQGYYLENKVRYLCLDGAKGFAIVEGTESYMVEFEYRNGEISRLICECPCSYTCKHEFAAMLQLRETLDLIEKHYSAEYARTGYFAAINKGTLFSFAIDCKETGSITL